MKTKGGRGSTGTKYKISINAFRSETQSESPHGIWGKDWEGNLKMEFDKLVNWCITAFYKSSSLHFISQRLNKSPI